MKVDLISHTELPEYLCGVAAAVCTNSGNIESALRHAVGSGHTSVLEHAVFTFSVEGLSRAALAQLTRHRLASFDVQSQRYVRLDGDPGNDPWLPLCCRSGKHDTLCHEPLSKDDRGRHPG